MVEEFQHQVVQSVAAAPGIEHVGSQHGVEPLSAEEKTAAEEKLPTVGFSLYFCYSGRR